MGIYKHIVTFLQDYSNKLFNLISIFKKGLIGRFVDLFALPQFKINI